MGCPYLDPLPETLLSGKQEIEFASHDEVKSLSKLDMTKGVWTDNEHQSARILAVHFSNVLTLNRLEIVSVVLEALASGHQNGAFGGDDVAYGLMSFLNQCIKFNKSNTNSQKIGSLSLANNSNHTTERTVSMFPRHDNSRRLATE